MRTLSPGCSVCKESKTSIIFEDALEKCETRMHLCMFGCLFLVNSHFLQLQCGRDYGSRWQLELLHGESAAVNVTFA